ncbi:hypothetical protein FACS1894196_4520 [Clostridia bacterium]|nr:hypothetical protein FACS1894196_4520 [Clostridia bacterium]
MVLVLLGLTFMWVVQIFLFEKNYVESRLNEARSSLSPVMEDLKTQDLATNNELLLYLSFSASGKMILLNRDGTLMGMYSNGHPIDMDSDEMADLVWHMIKDSEEYEKILRGESYEKIVQYEFRMTAFEIGIPAIYNGQTAYIILNYSLNELYTVLDFNRRQLILLSVILTAVASAVAFTLSRQFVKPIHSIKKTVDSLAEGDLAATPGLTLADELGQLSHSVEKLGQALQRVDVLRKEVIANVSHELRSPLALIAGYTEMVRDVSWNDGTRRNDNLNLILREARRMSEMVNDIMDYSQFQSGFMQLKKDWYNFCEIAESETSHCEQGAMEHGIRIQLSCEQPDIPAFIDALKISQVMRNLLYNAVNHTKDGEIIIVDIKKTATGFKASVTNPGEPIPKEEQDVIWERYQRSQHHGGRRQGTGLGLSIVSTILKAHFL